MFSTLRNAWAIPELRKKLIFTMMMLLIYRIGNVIPVPYIDAQLLTQFFDSTLSNTILGLYNAMSGSAFAQACRRSHSPPVHIPEPAIHLPVYTR